MSGAFSAKAAASPQLRDTAKAWRTRATAPWEPAGALGGHRCRNAGAHLEGRILGVNPVGECRRLCRHVFSVDEPLHQPEEPETPGAARCPRISPADSPFLEPRQSRIMAKVGIMESAAASSTARAPVNAVRPDAPLPRP